MRRACPSSPGVAITTFLYCDKFLAVINPGQRLFRPDAETNARKRARYPEWLCVFAAKSGNAMLNAASSIQALAARLHPFSASNATLELRRGLLARVVAEPGVKLGQRT